MAFGLTAGAAAALAATRGELAGNGTYVGGVTFSGPEPLVLWNLPGSGGRTGTCIEANVNGPLHGPYTRQSSISDPVYAELNHLYANSTSSDVELGELSALNSAKFDLIDKSVQWGYVKRGKGGMSQAGASSMLARARALAGPYTVTVTWPTSDNRVGVDYRATITVRSAAGSTVPGAAVSVVGSGVKLSAATATTNSSGAASAGFGIAAGSSSTVSITATVKQWTTLDVYRSRGEQAMLVSATPTTARGVHSAPVTRTRAVTLVKVDAADHARTPVAGYRFRIAALDGSVITSSVTSAATPVDIDELPVGETYTATEIGVPAGASLYIPRTAATTFTVPAGTGTWSVVVADPERPRPSVQTQATPEQALVGQRLSDRVRVTGNDGEDGTITARVYGPVQVPASGRCSDLDLVAYQSAPSTPFSAAVQGASNNGNGTVEVLGPIVERPGCYGWQETLTLAPSGVTVSSPPTTPHEASLVTRPEVRTTTSAQVATPGTRLHDHVTVTGLNGHGASLTAQLYGPLPADRTVGCRRFDDAAWRRAIGPSLLVGTAHAPVSSDGELNIGSFTVARPGCYTWVEALTPTDGSEPVHTPYGQASETTVVIAPAVTTVATPSRAEPNGSLRDLVNVSGTAGTATTLTGALLGPVPPVGGSCAGLDWTKAPVAGTFPALRVNHDGRYLSAPVKTAAAGCYTFRETLLSTETLPASVVAVTKPGVPAETVLVSARHTPLAVTGLALDGWLLGGSGLSGLGLLVLLVARHGSVHGGRHRLVST